MDAIPTLHRHHDVQGPASASRSLIRPVARGLPARGPATTTDTFVVLTTVLIHKNSHEAKDSDEDWRGLQRRCA
jgi:hypothetical protein